MPGTGIWLPDEVYQQQQGQLWMQGQVQALQGQVQAGQQWASQQMARLQQQAQQQVQAITQAAPPPAPVSAPTAAPPAPISVAPPTPAPTPVTAPAPAPAPVQTTPPVAQPPPPPTSTVPTDMLQAGQDWASQQVQNLLQPSQTPAAAPQTAPAAMQPSPAPSAPGASGGPAMSLPAPAAAQGPTPTTPTSAPASATASSGSVPAGPQPNTPGDLIDQARQAAAAAGIDPDIFARQIQQESGFDPNAKSGAGALGIAQFMPGTAQGLGIDPTNPVQALAGAAKLDAQNLAKYGGDWAKTLAAYNAGGGNVDQYGGVPPFAETQNYVNTILGGAKNVMQQVGGAVQGALQTGQQAVQNVVQTGQTAVNNGVQAAQAAVARTSQFAMGLSSGDAIAFCGPAAAMAFAQTYGRNPTVDEAKQLAQQVGWNAQQGMAGVGSEVKLLNAMGVDAHATQGVDWASVGRDAQGGNPVIIDTPGHYYYVDGYNADTGQFHVGTSGTDLKGGSEWMTSDQINQMPQSEGAARAAVFADHPLAAQPGLAQSTAAQTTQAPASANQPTYMTTLQPATPADTNLLQPSNPAQDLLNAASRQAQNVSSAVQSKAQDVLSAVQNVGGQALSTGQNALNAWQQQAQQPTGLYDIFGNPIGGPGSNLDLTKPLGPQLGIDPYGQIVQQGVPNIVRGVQTGDIGAALGGALQTGLGVLSAQPGAGGAEAAGAPLLERAVSDIPWSQASLDALNRGPQATSALPGVLQSIDQAAQARALGVSPDVLAGNFDQLGRRIPAGAIENPLTSAELGQPSWDQYGVLQRAPALYSDRGIAIDPVSGQEVLPSDAQPGITPNSWAVASAANPGATLMRTAGNQFVPVVQQAPMQGADVLTGLQGMLDQRHAALADTLDQLTQTVEQQSAPAIASQPEAQAGLQAQVDALKARAQDLLQSSQPGQINPAFARLLGGAALGGGGMYLATDPNDPNRGLKIAAGALGGGLLGGPGIDAAMTGQLGQIVRSARVGSIAGGIPTLTHIALNAPVQTGLKFAADIPADVLTGRVAAPFAEAYGALQGFRAWALDAANQLAQPGPLAQAMGGGLGPQALETGLTGLVRLHGPLQDLAGSMGRYMDLYRGAANTATDTLGRTAQGSAPWRAQVANLIANPTSDMLSSATAAEQRASLNTPPGTTGQGIMNLITGENLPRELQQASPLFRFMLPIWQKGYAIATQGVEMTPLGWAGTAVDVARGLAGTGPYAGGWGERGAAGAVTPLAQRVRNATIGLGLMYEGYTQAGQTTPDGLPVITGEGPSDPKQQAALRDLGWQPDSTYIGGRYVDNHLLGPVGMALGWGANVYEATHPYGLQVGGQQIIGPGQGGYQRLVNTPQGARAPNALDVLGDVVAREGQFFNNETFLSSLGSTLNLIGGGVQQGQGIGPAAAGITRSLIPQSALLGNVASATDPYQRVTAGATPTEQFQRALEVGLPGLRQDLPARLSGTGQPLPNPQQGAGLVVPRSSIATNDPVLQAMAQVGIPPAAAPPSLPYGPNGEIQLTPDEQQHWAQYRGDLVQQAAGPLVNSPQWSQLGIRGQYNALTTINRNADAAASRMLLGDVLRSPDAQQRVIGTNVLAPINAYGISNPQVLYQQQLQQQALLQALQGGQSGFQAGLQALQAGNAARGQELQALQSA